MPATPHPDDIKAGANVRQARQRRGMSQETLAAYLGLTYQQVQKYEKGANRMSVSRLAQIARALDVRLSVLLEGIEDGEAGALTPRTAGLAERLEALPLGGRTPVELLVDRMTAP